MLGLRLEALHWHGNVEPLFDALRPYQRLERLSITLGGRFEGCQEGAVYLPAVRDLSVTLGAAGDGPSVLYEVIHGLPAGVRFRYSADVSHVHGAINMIQASSTLLSSRATVECAELCFNFPECLRSVLNVALCDDTDEPALVGLVRGLIEDANKAAFRIARAGADWARIWINDDAISYAESEGKAGGTGGEHRERRLTRVHHLTRG